uniref:Uncharacterized protein n=1 Tax=Rhizophora mucronata TaxID=61149 RepID=A0A2P2NCA6_RHIMU
MYRRRSSRDPLVGRRSCEFLDNVPEIILVYIVNRRLVLSLLLLCRLLLLL